MIKFENVSYEYVKDYRALSNISLEIKSNELVFITGESGSGKTTLLKLIMGIIKPTTGNVIVLNESMNMINRKKLNELRRNIGPIFQEFRLLQGMNVYENVVLPLRFQNVNKDSYKSIIEENLNKVGLVHKIESNIESLSWGETQRVAIARAIINKPKLIIADEPTGNLDQKNSMRILSTLNSLVNENTTVIITTHATHLLENFPNGRILIMENGYLGGRHEK